MGYSQYDPAIQERVPWNVGKKVGPKRPLTQKQIWAVRYFLDREGRLRDRALFDLAIDSKLRGCDLVRIKIGDLVAGNEMRRRATVMQQKTHRPVQFELTGDVRTSLLAWFERRAGTIEDYAFPSRIDCTRHLSTRQYARLVDEWVTAIGLRREEFGTHSLRRTSDCVRATVKGLKLGLTYACQKGAPCGGVHGAPGLGVPNWIRGFRHPRGRDGLRAATGQPLRLGLHPPPMHCRTRSAYRPR